MVTISRTLVLLLTLTLSVGATAQVQNRRQAYEQRRQAARKQFEDNRKQALMNYADAVKKAWARFEGEPGMEMPEEELVVPVLASDADAATESWWSDQVDKVKNAYKKLKNALPKIGRVKPIVGNGEELSHSEVITPLPPVPQPQPLAPVKEVKEETQQPEAPAFRDNDYMSFTLFGTEFKVRIGDNCRPTLKSLECYDVAEALKAFTQPQYDNLLYDCLQERKNHALSDWCYYLMLQALTEKFYGKYNNVGTLVQAFLYSQSGYKMRMGHDANSLFMLVASRHYIYGKTFITLGQEQFYLLDGRNLTSVYVSEAAFPKEGAMSLQLSAEQLFSLNAMPQRVITSTKNSDFSFSLVSNKNYIDFYNTYPSSTIGGNVMTKWVMYAETPLEKGVRDQLYPPMRQKLKGLSQLDAVQQLLWWVQTGFEYEYDDKVWGGDRPFFGEESLYYPYCDCEDRAILFSHLVRDLVGLDVVLVYYEGHLASAVAFNEEVKGDYFTGSDGRKFTVCDPTIIPGRVGQTMTYYIGKPASIILLKRG